MSRKNTINVKPIVPISMAKKYVRSTGALSKGVKSIDTLIMPASASIAITNEMLFPVRVVVWKKFLVKIAKTEPMLMSSKI